MRSYLVYQQLVPKRVGKDDQGQDEYEARLIHVGEVVARDGRDAIAKARQRFLTFRLGYQKSSLHSRPVVEEL